MDVVVLPSDNEDASWIEDSCSIETISLGAAAPPPPNPRRSKADMEKKRADLAAAQKQAPLPPAPTMAPLPSFLWKTTPPADLPRAFAEAGVQSVAALSATDLICRVDIKHANRWNEPRGPDPIVRLAWGAREDLRGNRGRPR